MSHLTLETLARLVDEPAAAGEAAHLDACSACREELQAMKASIAALGELPDLLPPPARTWPALEARLRREGLLRSRRVGHGSAARTLLRLAAGLALFLLGGASGFTLQARLGERPAPSAPHIAAAPAGAATDVARSLEEAEAIYLTALKRYATATTAAETVDPLARLAALENIVLTTREALNAAPADPVLNGYHLTALAQREATLEQIVLASNDGWY